MVYTNATKTYKDKEAIVKDRTPFQLSYYQLELDVYKCVVITERNRT